MCEICRDTCDEVLAVNIHSIHFSPANVDAAKMWRDDREAFKKIARKHVNKVKLIVQQSVIIYIFLAY